MFACSELMSDHSCHACWATYLQFMRRGHLTPTALQPWLHALTISWSHTTRPSGNSWSAQELTGLVSLLWSKWARLGCLKLGISQKSVPGGCARHNRDDLWNQRLPLAAPETELMWDQTDDFSESNRQRARRRIFRATVRHCRSQQHLEQSPIPAAFERPDT